MKRTVKGRIPGIIPRKEIGCFFPVQDFLQEFKRYEIDAGLNNCFDRFAQIPTKPIFISNEPNKALKMPFGTIHFKHSALRESSFRYLECGVLFQSLGEIGQANLTKALSARNKTIFSERILEIVRHDNIPSANLI